MRLEISAQDGRSEEAKTKASFVFDVYPEIYWEPLAIASNNSILVEESTSIAITRYDLQVESRQEMLPKDIIYTVISIFLLFINKYFTLKSKKKCVQMMIEENENFNFVFDVNKLFCWFVILNSWSHEHVTYDTWWRCLFVVVFVSEKN